MALLAEPLVGRADELGSLDQVLSELDRGRAGAIELAGEPGIGKTRLLRELAHHAEACGHLVLSGSAAELEQDPPFSVFVDALDEYVGGLGPTRFAAFDDDVRTELGHVFPSLVGACSGPRGGAPARALPQSPCDPHAARAACDDEAAGARARRLPMGRRGIIRAARRLAPPAAGCSGADRLG